MKNNLTLIILLSCLLTAHVATAQSGGNFALTWSTLDSGGGPSAGGGFTLNGTIGQPDAGVRLSGGGFTVTGGFWAGATESSPRLFVRLSGGNTVILSWPNPSTGYVLEQATNVDAPAGGWSVVAESPVVVGTNREVSLPVEGTRRFFRLRLL